MTERIAAPDPKPPKGGLRILTGFKGSEKDLLALFTVLEAHRRMEEIATKALAAYNEVDWVASSPDGLLGGQGYLMTVRELREKLVAMLQMLGESKHPLIDECYHNPVWRKIKTNYVKRNHPINTVPDPTMPEEDGTSEPGPGLENLPEESKPEPPKLERETPFEFLASGLDSERDIALVAMRDARRRAGVERIDPAELMVVANHLGGDFRDEEHVRSCVSSLVQAGYAKIDSDGLVSVVEGRD